MVFSNNHKIMLVKNQDYLNWRYVAIPDIDYSIYVAEKSDEVCGYIVFRTMLWDTLRMTIIFNVLALSPDIAQYLIAKAVEESQKEDVDLVYCSIIADNNFLSSFRCNGFMGVPNTGQGFTIESTHPNIPMEFLRNPKNWFIQIGDSDFF